MSNSMLRYRTSVAFAALVLLGVVVGTPAGVAAAPTDPTPVAADFSSFRGDPGQTGSVVGDDLAPPLSAGWSVRLGGEVNYPLIVGGDVFAAAQSVLSPVGSGGRLTVVDVSLSSGAIKWSTVVAGSTATLSYGAGVLVVSTLAQGTEGLSAATGNVLWTLADSSPSPSVVVAGTAFMSVDTKVIAVDVGDGVVVWTANTGVSVGDVSEASGQVYAQDESGELWVFDAATGAVVEAPTNSHSGGADAPAPEISGGEIYDANYNNDNEVESQSSDQLTGGFTGGPWPVVTTTDMYSLVQGQTPAAIVREEDRGTGTIRWQHELPDTTQFAPMLGDNGYTWLLDQTGELRAFDDATGAISWQSATGAIPDLNDAHRAGMAAGGGYLVIATTTGLVALTGTGASGCGANGCDALPADSTVQPSSAPDQSTSYEVDNGHDGDQPATTLAPPLMSRWGVQFEGQPTFPLAADGMTFTVVRAPGASGGMFLQAVADSTGAARWGPIDLGPGGVADVGDMSYADGELFVVAAPGLVEARSAQTGALLWSRAVVGAGQVQVVHNEVIVGGGFLDALDPTTGAVLWSSFGGPLMTAGDGLLFTSISQGVQAVDPANGKTVWSTSSNDVEGLAYAHGQLVTTNSAGADLINPMTGALTQQLTTRGMLSGAYDSAGRYLVVNGVLQKRAWDSDDVLWTFHGDGLFGTTPPVIAGSAVYASTNGGQVYALDAGSGAILWQGATGDATGGDHATSQASPASLLVADGNLLVTGADRLLAFSTPSASPAAVPGAVGAPTATAWDGAAYVSWTAPAYAGGDDPITAYRITAQPGGTTETVDGSSSGGLVSGLSDGTAYAFTVEAENAQGWGAASLASLYPVTPAAGAWRLQPLPAPIGATVLPGAVNQHGEIGDTAVFPNDEGYPATTTGTATTYLSSLPGLQVVAINDNGDVAGDLGSSGAMVHDNQLTRFGTVQDVVGIDDDDQVAGSIYHVGALIDDHHKVTRLTPKDPDSAAHAMSMNEVVVGQRSGVPYEWTATTRKRLPSDGLTETVASAISPNGRIVTGVGVVPFALGLTKGLLWKGASTTTFNGADGCQVDIAVPNNAGDLVGSSCAPGPVATVWRGRRGQDANALIAPNDTWYLATAVGVDNAGVIVGVGYDEGIQTAFLLRPPAGQTLTAALTSTDARSEQPRIDRTIRLKWKLSAKLADQPRQGRQ